MYSNKFHLGIFYIRNQIFHAFSSLSNCSEISMVQNLNSWKEINEWKIKNEKNGQFGWIGWFFENFLIIPAISQINSATVHKNDKNDDGANKWFGCIFSFISS